MRLLITFIGEFVCPLEGIETIHSFYEEIGAEKPIWYCYDTELIKQHIKTWNCYDKKLL